MPAAEPKIIYNGITFNDFTTPDQMFLLQDIPEGMTPPAIEQNATERTGAHGANHGNNFYGRRFFILTGKIIAPDQSTRHTMEKQLLAAFTLPRNPNSLLAGFHEIEYTDESGDTFKANAKVAVAPKLAKEVAEPWYRDFSVTLEMEKYFWEGDQKSQEAEERITGTNIILDETIEFVESSFYLYETSEPAYELNNAGNYGAALFIRVFGPVSNPAIYNDTTGEKFAVDIELGEGETLEIDAENGLVTKTDSEGAETDQSAKITNDSTWIYLVGGDNAIRIEDDTPEKSDFEGEFYWKDTYL